MAERSVSATELESNFRKKILNFLPRSLNTRVVSDSMIDKNHPAALIADETGCYLVTIQKVTGALVENYSGETNV